MSELLITDLDENLKQRLLQSAWLKGTTPSEEAKNILDRVLPLRDAMPLNREELIRKADEISRKTGNQKTDSVQLIREDRDTR